VTTKEQQEFEKKVLDQFMSDKSLFGSDGAFAPMLKNVIEKALKAEMDSHLNSDERSKENKRNGKGNKNSKVALAPLIFKPLKTFKATSNPNWLKRERRFWRIIFQKKSSVFMALE
jgi:transposase-like protein|tara:strand:+ start:3136 stop:3483 length:348 start_codon:yes stop_codon:yes gene_type:complete